MKRISATEASRRFSDLLNRARYGGESFLVERRGEPIVEIRPVRRGGGTVGDLIEFLRTTPPPDPDWERDMREVIAERDRFPLRDSWAE